MRLRPLWNIRFLIIAVLICVTCTNRFACASPEQAGQPAAKYHYDEKMVLGGLDVACDQLRESLKRTGTTWDHPGPTNWQNEPAIVNIGWYIIALAEYSRGSEEVKRALFSVEAEFGYLGLPYWMGFEQRRKNIARFYSFSSGDGVTSLELPPCELLYSLGTQAEKYITERSGFKFEGYKGRAYGRLD